MKACVWVRSVEGRVLVGGAWKRKALWSKHAEYESENVAQSVALGLMKALPEWETRTVRVLAGDERPFNEVEYL